MRCWIAIPPPAIEAAAEEGGGTIDVVTSQTAAPAAGKALSTATGEGAEALAQAARPGGKMFTPTIPKALLYKLEQAGLVQRGVTMMTNGAVGTEIRFLPQAAEFIVKFFKPMD